jgi:flagellar biosynthesis/type III secretory pathway protein FliH
VAVEAAMKSFNNVHSSVSSQQLESWIPSDLGVETVDISLDIQKEKMLTLFRAETLGRTTKKEVGINSVLHSGEACQNYAPWLPGKIDSQPAKIRKVEWAFLEPVKEDIEITPAESNNAKPEVLAEVAPPVPQRDIEKEISLLLDQARLQAEEIILAAQAEADNVLLQAEEEIEEQKKAGYQQSWDKACAEVESTLKATHGLVEEVSAWKTDLMTQGEHILVDMLREMAQKMFGEGVELDTNALQLNLNHVMENAHGLGNLNIFLNPRDAKIMDPAWSEYQMLVSGGKVKIIPSGQITRGGCFVKGDMGVVDGRVETQLSAVLKVFNQNTEVAK